MTIHVLKYKIFSETLLKSLGMVSCAQENLILDREIGKQNISSICLLQLWTESVLLNFLCWNLNYQDDLTFGDREFKEGIKVKWAHKDGVPIQHDCVLIRRERDSGMLEHRGKVIWGPHGKSAISKIRRVALGEIKRDDTLIFDFRLVRK